ncbi:MAG: hypothetical protein GY782_10585 [Gammaproteobacteria bacterium]|nr:hypothetical protein [Gammaproteobacteria bacterium]
MKFRELMKSLVPWPFRQTGRLKICAYCGLRASAFGFPWPAAVADTPGAYSLDTADEPRYDVFDTFSNGESVMKIFPRTLVRLRERGAKTIREKVISEPFLSNPSVFLSLYAFQN